MGYSYKGPNFGEKPLQVDIKAYYSHTKTTQLRKGELALLLKNNGLSDKGLKRDLWQRVCKNTLIPATVKPDGDNVAKSVLDALNGIAYDDDSQCIDIRIRKYRSFDPRVEVELKIVEG